MNLLRRDSPPQIFMQALSKRKWKRLGPLHKKSNGFSPSTDQFEHENHLHTMCSNNPSLDDIRNLIQALPQSPFELDVFDQTALHVAATYGASHEVINQLIKVNPQAAHTKDFRNRSPLMLACGSIACCVNNEKNRTNTTKIIRALIDASPASIIDRDSMGNSALDYALKNKLPQEAVTMLEKLCFEESIREVSDWYADQEEMVEERTTSRIAALSA